MYVGHYINFSIVKVTENLFISKAIQEALLLAGGS